MTENNDFPYQVALYKPKGKDSLDRNLSRDYHVGVIKNILDNVIPVQYIFSEKEDERKKLFQGLLPLVTWSKFKTVPFELSFFLVCKLRYAVSKFFYEMIHWWLLPGKFVNITSVFAADFRLPELGNEIYTTCELGVWLETEEEFKMACYNLPSIEAELRLGTSSVYHANRILEVKGLSVDIKTAMIQENIVSLMHRRPNDFNYDIFMEMQRFLVDCASTFKISRDYQHMSRIVVLYYLFRKKLRDIIAESPNKRHIIMRVFKAKVYDDNGTKNVLAVILGINFLVNNEFLEEHHLLKAIKTFLPHVSVVDGSFMAKTSDGDKICAMYIEIVKNNGEDFTSDEISILRSGLPEDLKGRISHLMYSVFMPRNEEEVMRNILSLDGEIKYVTDVPQVIISFDKQTDLKISFTVIMVRLLKKESLPIEDIFDKAETFLDFYPEQIKIIGCLRKKYDKEANVFRVELDKSNFLRADHALDLYKARRAVVDEIFRIVGEFRDYNGGLITKQNEVFCNLKNSLGEIGEHHVFLLENFFYSLIPSVMRNILDHKYIKIFFEMLLGCLKKGFEKGENYSLTIKEDDCYLYVMLTADSSTTIEKVRRKIDALKIEMMKLATAFLVVHDIPCLGYMYNCDDREQKDNFINTVKRGLE